MTGNIQFTNSKGDGSLNTYSYVTGDLTIGGKDGKDGKLYYFDYLSENYITLKFRISHLSMNCNFLDIRGRSEKGGNVNFLMETKKFWEAEVMAERLKSVYRNTRKYFMITHGITEKDEKNGINFVEIARKIIKGNY